MTFNKEFFKRASTFANAAGLLVASAMAFIPDLVGDGNQSLVMMVCGVVVTACQIFSKEAKKEAENL